MGGAICLKTHFILNFGFLGCKIIGHFKREDIMKKKLFSLGPFFHTKTLIVFTLFCTLTFLTACKSPESPEETADTYYLSGTVTDKSTGLPITGALVSVLNPGVAKKTTTSAEGSYSITYTGTGRYVQGTGTRPCMLEVLSGDYQNGYADLASTAGTYTIDFQLKPRSN